MLTKYSHLQDGEIVLSVLNNSQASELEQELATRLGDAMDANAELTTKLSQWNPYMRKTDVKTRYVGDA